MDFEQAKTVLLEGYSRLEMNVSDQGTALHVQCEGNTYVVTEEDILTYAEQYPRFAALAVAPCECGISSVNYREQIVVPIEPSPIAPIGIRFREPTTFRQQGDNRFVEIGVVTQLFRNRLRFHEPFLEQHSARMRRPAAFMFRERDEHRQIDIVETMPSFLTARVFNISAPTVEQAVKDTSALIEACLFELSYLKGTSVALSEEWPQRQSRGRTFRLTEAFPGNDLPLPTASFNADIVRFYQRGVSTRDPVIQFLSFYHVLEYFFITASDDRLHATLATRLNDPAFSPTPNALQRLVRDVLEHRRLTDETEMLRTVLERYVPLPDLIEFVEAYETHRGDKVYTKRRQIFGEDLAEVRLAEGHLYPNIAKRIKVIRNAVVHSSDRHEGHERFIPLTARSEEIIQEEVSLMRFLAEKVIIATART